MNTGLIESWTSDPSLIGPMYPFVGTEVLFFIICVVLWLAWTVWQIRSENGVYERDRMALRQANNLQKAVQEYQAAARSFFGD